MWLCSGQRNGKNSGHQTIFHSWAGIHEAQPSKPTVVRLIGSFIDYAMIKCAGCQSWFANLVLDGYTFMDPRTGWLRLLLVKWKLSKNLVCSDFVTFHVCHWNFSETTFGMRICFQGRTKESKNVINVHGRREKLYKIKYKKTNSDQIISVSNSTTFFPVIHGSILANCKLSTNLSDLVVKTLLSTFLRS